MKYRLIDASPADETWLEGIRRCVYAELFQATWGSWVESRHKRHFVECIASGHISIIELDGVRVGMIQLFDKPGVVEIGEIEVLPSYQNRGIGTCVLKDVIGRAHRCGKTVRLSVGLTNDKSFRLYQRLGFKLAERSETHHHMVCEPRDNDPATQ